jgi:hypothetical protein
VRCPLDTVDEAGNLLCETFTRIVKLVHNSETEAREVEGMLQDIAQNGGLELCVKIVQDERRGLHGPHAMPDEREWVKELQSLANRCWATFSKDVDLKRCSYEVSHESAPCAVANPLLRTKSNLLQSSILFGKSQTWSSS